MTGYTKLFGSILDSTVWLESTPIKVVWITMLAMADRDGVVEASVPGLAKRAGVTREECECALAVFLAPDPDSRTQDYQGRRIGMIDAGWRLLNYDVYRERASAEEAREKAAERKRRQRARAVSRAVSRAVPKSHESHDIAAAPAPAPAPSKAKEQKQSTAPLITSPLAYEKRKSQCAFIGSRLEVPHVLHGELRKLLGGDDPESKLMGFYLALNDEIDVSGEPITPDVFKWLKNRFMVWTDPTSQTVEEIIASVNAFEKSRGLRP